MIETARLRLRQHRRDDLDAYAAMLGDPRTVRFIGGTALRRDDAWIRLQRALGHWALYGYGLWSVFELAGGRFVGEIGLAHFERGLGQDVDGWPEAAWILAAEVEGRGYAQEAAEAAHGWLDARRGAGRSVCIIHPDNAPSLRLAARLGYLPERRATYRGAPVIILARHPGTASRRT